MKEIKDGKILLVGDNPFHNISHFSQDRAKLRDPSVVDAAHAAELVVTSIDNGANGFMFSVSETTLSIVEKIREMKKLNGISLFALVPYSYEYVRLATQAGGIPGLAKVFSKRLVLSGNLKAIAAGTSGLLKGDLVSLLEAYLFYEISRIKSSAGRHAELTSIILHEVIVDMALALGLDWLFIEYIAFLKKRGYIPGFNTVNFAYLVDGFKRWNIDLTKVLIAAPFNKIGFQMNPSREKCEEALEGLSKPNLIAISILAAGYLKLDAAVEYISSLPNLRGVAVGVSKQKHAEETFRFLRTRVNNE